MEKIKNLLSPGGNKDDAVKYGDPETRLRESRENPTPETAVTAPQTDNVKQGGVLSQLTNPDGNKYDETAYRPVEQTGKDTKSGGVLSQITNPDGNKYDEQRFDETKRAGGLPTTAPTATGSVIGPNTVLETKPEAEKEHGVLRQLINPGGRHRDDVAFGSTAVATEDTRAGQSSTAGVAGTSAAGTAPGSTVPVGGTTTTQTLPDRSVNSTAGRDAALLGTGAAVGTGAGVGAIQHHEQPGSVLDRSHPLRDGTSGTGDHINPVGAPAIDQSSTTTSPNVVSTHGTADRSVDSHINPVGAPATTGTVGAGHSSLNREAAVVGGAGGAGLVGATAASHSGSSGIGSTTAPAPTGLSSYNDNSNFGRDTGLVGSAGLAGAGAGAASSGLGHSSSVGQTQGQGFAQSGQLHPGYVHHTTGPHPSDIANVLDPNLDAGPGAGLAPASGHPLSGGQTGTGSHLGRDAALVGGAGAVGAGAYAASRDHNTTTAPVGSAVGQTPATYSSTNPTANQTGSGSHLGRDAALVGGAGAVGTGAYAASRDHNTTRAPVGSTVGQTPAIYGSANPTVDQTGSGSHLGRDAALVGGAGAVGAGTYGAARDNTATTAAHGTAGHTPASYGGTNPAIDPKHGSSLGHTSTTYGGTNPAVDPKHGAGLSHQTTTYGGTHPEIDRKHQTAGASAGAVGAAGVYGGGSALTDDKHERKLQHAREEEAEKGGDHGEKKPSLIQKILHPGSHGKDDSHDKHHDKAHDKHQDKHHDQHRSTHESEVREGGEVHEHGHHKTIVDEKGHTKLYKDPPANHPAAQAQAGVAGPDWDAVNQANRTT